MAMAIITLREDEGEDAINITIEFEPRVKMDDDEDNPFCHALAMAMVDYAGKILSNEGGEVKTAKVDGKEVEGFKFNEPLESLFEDES